MPSSTSSSDVVAGPLRVGLASLGQLLRWVCARLWLAAALCALWIAALALLGLTRPLAPYGGDHAIVDEQILRSRALGATDVLLLGDSSGLTAVDPVVLSRELGGRSCEMLSVIGPVRPPGYARLLRNYLDRSMPLEAAIFVLHPFALMHAYDESRDGSTLAAVLEDRWPSEGFAGDLRCALNRHLFAGLLEEPLAGSFGVLYGNGRELRRALSEAHGSVVHPGKPLPGAAPGSEPNAAAEPAAIDYRLSDDGRRSLEHMRDILAPVRGKVPIFVAFAPVPASIAGEKEAGARSRLLREVVRILGLPPERALELPASLPDEQMVDPTHAAAPGRAAFSARIAPLLQRVLGPPPLGR